MGKPLRIGVIGCGNIITQYLATFPQLATVKIVAVADLDFASAEAVAADQPGVRALSVDDLLADPAADLVLNLTIPAAHADIALRAIAAGKAVYGEKPLAATTDEARKVLEAAAAAGAVIGAASHTRSSRTIGKGPRAGETVPVGTDTHVTGVLAHESGALSNAGHELRRRGHAVRQPGKSTGTPGHWSCRTPTVSTAT